MLPGCAYLQNPNDSGHSVRAWEQGAAPTHTNCQVVKSLAFAQERVNGMVWMAPALVGADRVVGTVSARALHNSQETT
jgi:hypothetical protein